MLKRVAVFFWFLSAAVIVGLAVALSTARVLLPTMSAYKSDLEALTSARLRHPVVIGSLSASWRGMSPALSLRNLRIEDPRLDNGALEIGEVRVVVDIWRSLLDWRWQTRLLEVSDTSVSIHHEPDGRWTLFANATPEAGTDWLDQLFAQGRIGFRHARITVVDAARGGLTRVFRDARFNLTNAGSRHQFSLALQLPGTLGTGLEASGDFSGTAVDMHAWSGRLYAKIDGANLANWAEYAPVGASSPTGTADAEVWLEWGQGINRIGGRVRLEGLTLGERGAEPTYSVQRLSGRFLWTRNDTGWRVEADEIGFRRSGLSDVDGVALSADWKAAGHQFRMAANRLPLHDVGQLVRLVPGTPAPVQTWLGRLEPRGLVQDLELDARLADAEHPQVAFKARFNGLSTASFEQVPGISGLSGRVQGNLQAGEVHFDSADATFNAPHLFRQPLQITRLSGGIAWTRYVDRMRVEGDGIQIASADLATRSRLLLDWIGDASMPWMDLRTEFDEVAISAVHTYLPAGIMPPRTVEWLDSALQSGVATNGRFVLQGIPDEIPFGQRQGLLLATFDFDDVTLAYHPDWGRLQQLRGHAEFRNASMRIVGDEGHILDTSVRRVVATIDDFLEPQLHIEGTVAGQLPAMLAYVQTTPLAPRFAGLMDALRPGGDADLQLELSIPLHSPSARTHVVGDLNVRDGTLAHRDRTFELTQVQGDINFTEDGVRASGVTAQFDGAPAVLNITAGSDPHETLVTLDGAPDLVKRVRAFGPIGAELEGRAQSRVRVRFTDTDATDRPPVQVELESDLRGIGSLLPAPFGKLKDDAVAFLLRWAPGHMDRWPLEFNYGGDVKALALFDAQGKVRSGALTFGAAAPQLPDKAGFAISGHLVAVSPLAWGKLFSGDGTETGSGKAAFPPLQFDLAVDRLSLFDYVITGIRVTSAATDPWRFRIDGADTAGSLHLVFDPNGSLNAVEATLDRLLLGVPDTRTLDAQRNRVRSLSPATMPRLAFDVDRLTWGDKPLGHLKLETARAERGVDIQTLQLQSDALVADATGQWYLVQGNQSTRLSIDVKGGTLENLLRLFGDRTSVAGAPLKGFLHATWNGSPADFSLNGLKGELNVDLGEGRLVDVKPGAGKLLGLLSLQSLPRRLLLDFSDIFKKGFGFDTIKGDFQLTDTNAYTDNLHISGPAADIYVSGRTGLLQQDYDEIVTLVPRLSSTLPIAGAIAGGPAVGAAVLLAERLFGDQVNKMNKVEYHVTGNWADPKYERVEKSATETRSADGKP